MRSKITAISCAAAMLLCVTPLSAQIFGTGATGRASTGTGTDQRTQGFQQTGQLSSDAAISRDANTFVGGASGSFLGRTGTGTTGTTGANGLTGLSGLSGLGGLGGLNSFGGGLGGFGRNGLNGGFGAFGNQFGQGAGTQSTTRQIRTSLRAAFPLSPGARTAVISRFQQRLPKIPGLESADSVVVSMDGGTAVLQGVVADEHQRDLVERLALLEPGIADVRNELSVGSPESLPELVPPPRAD